jgi:hypothetical protein
MKATQYPALANEIPSAPPKELQKRFGFQPDLVVTAAKE